MAAENGGGPIAGLVFELLTIAAGLALIVVQYRLRLRRYSVAAGVAGLLVAYGMSTYVPWPDLHAGARASGMGDGARGR